MGKALDYFNSQSSSGSSTSDSDFFAALSGPKKKDEKKDPVASAKETIRDRSEPDTSFLDPDTESDRAKGREAAKKTKKAIEKGLTDRLKDDILGEASDTVDRVVDKGLDAVIGDSPKKIGDVIGKVVDGVLSPIEKGVEGLSDARRDFESEFGIPAPIGGLDFLVGGIASAANALGSNTSEDIAEASESDHVDPVTRSRRDNQGRPCPGDGDTAADGSRCGGRSAESRGPTSGYDTPQGFFEKFNS